MINDSVRTSSTSSFSASSYGPGPQDLISPSQPDEMVFDERTGTFTGFQAPPTLAQVLAIAGAGRPLD